MKQKKLQMLVVITAVLASFVSNAYAQEVDGFCQEQDGKQVCEKYELISPILETGLLSVSPDVLAVKFIRPQEWVVDESVPYDIGIYSGAEEKCVVNSFVPRPESPFHPYYGKPCGAAALQNGEVYQIKVVRGADFKLVGEFTFVTDTIQPKFVMFNPGGFSFYNTFDNGRANLNAFKVEGGASNGLSGESVVVKVSDRAEQEIYSKEFVPNSIFKWNHIVPDTIEKGLYLVSAEVPGRAYTRVSAPILIDRLAPKVVVSSPKSTSELERLKLLALKEVEGFVQEGDGGNGAEVAKERYARVYLSITKKGEAQPLEGFDGVEFYADESGNYLFVPNAPISENGVYTITLRAKDQANNPTGAPTTVEFQIVDPEIAVSTPTTLDQPQTTLSGTGTAGTSVVVQCGMGGELTNVSDEPVVVDNEGNWSVQVSTAQSGEYKCKVTGSYAGKEAVYSEGNGEVTFTITLPAGAITPTLDSGSSEVSVNQDYAVSGTGTAGSTVVVTIVDDQGNQVGEPKTVTVGDDGKWTTNVQFANAGNYKVNVKYQGSDDSVERDVTVKADSSNGDGSGSNGDGNGTDGNGTGGDGSGNVTSGTKDGGCGCATPGTDVPSSGFLMAILGMIGWVSRKRRNRRS